jgi:hypothetical protein
MFCSLSIDAGGAPSCNSGSDGCGGADGWAQLKQTAAATLAQNRVALCGQQWSGTDRQVFMRKKQHGLKSM